jgi:hypothetical protein
VLRDWRGEPAAGGQKADPDREGGFRTHGKSKDSRDDLPQIVVGLAVTREAIPVRVWCWPGNTADSALIRQVKKDMRDWSLGRVIWVAGRGFASRQNRRFLQQGAGGYIIGEKLRSGSAEAAAALSRQGRYQHVAGNLQVKEVRLPDAGDRFVVCFNPGAAERDARIRAGLISKLEELIAGSDKLTTTKRAELRGKISTMPGLNRFLRVTPGGLLRADKAKAKAEENLDGKYLLRCADPNMTAEDIALGYKQLLEVERGWRDMKTILELRPVYHRLEERIRAHVLLCWLALLLIRVAENQAGTTWTRMRRELDWPWPRSRHRRHRPRRHLPGAASAFPVPATPDTSIQAETAVPECASRPARRAHRSRHQTSAGPDMAPTRGHLQVRPHTDHHRSAGHQCEMQL